MEERYSEEDGNRRGCRGGQQQERDVDNSTAESSTRNSTSRANGQPKQIVTSRSRPRKGKSTAPPPLDVQMLTAKDRITVLEGIVDELRMENAHLRRRLGNDGA